MLSKLYIQNYALISKLEIDFEQGFSVLTGETGAGKSIILGALNLVMGGRADTKTITEGEEKCIIEATFIKNNNEDIIIRRELNISGRSRSFVNDEVITQTDLKKLSKQLIDIHSQHENLFIGDTQFQTDVVDTIANNSEILESYSHCYVKYIKLTQQLQETLIQTRKLQEEFDYLTFQHKQLEEANLQEDELILLEEEEYRLSHAEDIKHSLMNALNYLDNETCGALTQIHNVRIDDASTTLAERLNSLEIELRDVVNDIQRLANRTEMDPNRLTEVQERISLLHTLMKKHRVTSINELIDIKKDLNSKLQRVFNQDIEIESLKQQLATQQDILTTEAKKLTLSRKSVCHKIEEYLISNMKHLGVSHASISIRISETQDFMPNGKDEVLFMFAANLNQSLRPICDVASGGEISRLMLCIKSLIAHTKELPTIIFDEIDTGVSGEIATQMGTIMQQMAQKRQIIAITHLAQIAAKGDAQYLVYKQDTETRTTTNIRHLNAEERIKHIASMVAGNSPTPAAIETAKQLLYTN